MVYQTTKSQTTEMTKSLQTNRFNAKTPTLICDNGTAISVPFYLNPSTDKKKELLNAFREIKTKQLIEQGYQQPRESNSIVVVDQTTPALAPIEQEMQMSEDALRSVLFGRQGVSERIILRLSDLTGVQVCTREEVEHTQKLWLDELYGTKTARKTSKKSSTTTTTKRQTKTKETD